MRGGFLIGSIVLEGSSKSISFDFSLLYHENAVFIVRDVGETVSGVDLPTGNVSHGFFYDMPLGDAFHLCWVLMLSATDISLCTLEISRESGSVFRLT
jgi:hypothetical protein